jgi:predicted phage tail protein
MGAAERIDITGAKGGSSSPKAPIEAVDSLRSTNLAKILIAVGEGEFDGTPTAANIYLDNTPINDASGNVNFPNVKWEWRTGAVDQPYIPGIPSVENETTVNVELRSDTAWVRSLTNTQLSAVRLRFAWPALQQQDDNGNVGGYRIEYAIDIATDGGAYQQVLDEAVDGKTTTRYERSRRIDLPSATTGWQIRVRRITPNQNTNKIADTMLVAGYTEVIDAKLRYPNTALLYIEFDAEQFTNIPAVTVDCNGRKWQVPSNYDPVARTYSGVWDGTFKSAWTNNPAWVTFGVCTVDRFGLGKRIKPFMVDKWELYRIAQYCDQLVPNGVGGQEPRFLCDMNLQGKAEAWTLLRDISAIYRGMTYWAEGQIVMQADMPRAQDIDYVFTRANVIDGKFSYGSASTKTRYTRAIVSYDNPANNYDTDVTAFADPELQRRFGDKPVEISAIGCTRASEAQRRGKWAVMSNNQDRTVTFKTGMEGEIPLPGYIIPIADSLLAGREIGGRISAAAGRVVTLDRDTLAKAGDRLIINLPSGKAEGRTVQSVAGRAVTLTTAYSETPAPQLQWALDADDLAIPLYRVLSRKRTTEGDYEFAALQFEPGKFAFIDTGARLEERPISVIPITVVPAPPSVTLTSTTAIAQGLAVTTMTITWPAVNGAVAYDVEWRKDNGNWIKVQRTGMTSVDITGIYRGAYLARVRAVSAYDISSIWRSSILTQLNGKEGLPPAVTSLTAIPLIFGIHLKWTFPPGADDTQRTEIWYSPNTALESATKLSDLAYPQSEYNMQGLLAGVTFFFWARLVDRTGNIGPRYPTGIGVMGQSSSEAGPILDMIAGQIGETELGQELQDKIDKIDDLQEQIDALDGLKAYDPNQTYLKGQMNVVDGRIFQAEQDVPVNTPPPNTAYWNDVGDLLETANGLAEQVSTHETEITEINGVLTSQASALQVLRAASRDDDGEGDAIDALRGWNATASFAQEVKVRTTQNSALAQQLTTLDATVGENEASLTTLTQTVATDKEATALAIQQLHVDVDDNSADIQTQSQAIATIDGKVSTSWSVKMQVTANGQYVAAGIGLGIENGPAGLQSQFLVSADRFAVVNTIAGGAIAVPFAVQGGQVFINQAFIQDGTITNAKIGSFISSTNYVQGQTGWRLNKDGTLEINGAVAGQGRLVVNNQYVAVYDANNVLRVKLGNLA